MPVLTFQSNFTGFEWVGHLGGEGRASGEFLDVAKAGIYIGLRLRSSPSGRVSSYKVDLPATSWSVELDDLPSAVFEQQTAELILVGVRLQLAGQPIIWTAVMRPKGATLSGSGDLRRAGSGHGNAGPRRRGRPDRRRTRSRRRMFPELPARDLGDDALEALVTVMHRGNRDENRRITRATPTWASSSTTT